jgi:hypothetical protein
MFGRAQQMRTVTSSPIVACQPAQVAPCARCADGSAHSGLTVLSHERNAVTGERKWPPQHLFVVSTVGLSTDAGNASYDVRSGGHTEASCSGT